MEISQEKTLQSSWVCCATAEMQSNDMEQEPSVILYMYQMLY